MIDINLKARLGKSKEKVVLELEKKGAKVKKGKESIDRVFIKKDLKFDLDSETNLKINSKYNLLDNGILNIKNEEDKIFINLKKNNKKAGKIIELESLVSDEEEIAEIIKLIGFEECFKIKRKRTKYLLDGISINIDYIEDLDYFIEVNKTVDNEKEECIVRDNIYELLSSVGIKDEDYILDSYETLMYKNKYSK